MAVLLIAGCASPPGSFSKSDFVWSKLKLNESYEDVYKRYIDASRLCRGMDYLRLVGYIHPETKGGYFDAFLPGDPITRIQSDFVAGKVTFSQDSLGSTNVEIGILNKYFNEKDSMGFKKQLRNYANGLFECP